MCFLIYLMGEKEKEKKNNNFKMCVLGGGLGRIFFYNLEWKFILRFVLNSVFILRRIM